MSLRRMMLFTLGAKIKSLVLAFKTRVLGDFGLFEAETCLEAQLTQLDNQSVLDNASLIVTPNGYEEGLLFAVKPSEVGTNLLLYSEDFSNAYWTKVSTTILSLQVPNPFLSARLADKITFSNNALARVERQNFPTIVGQQYTYSVWLRADTNMTLNLIMTNTVSVNVTTTWQRFSITITAATTTTTPQIRNNGAVGRDFYMWGAQLVTGSIVTDYIPTVDRAIINGTIGDMSVVRATIGTRVNQDGDIEQVPYNLLQRSEEVDNGIWTKTSLSTIQNTQTSPIGNLTADTIRIGVDALSVRHRFLQQLTFPPKTTYCGSYYLKKANHRWIQLIYVLSDYGTTSWANFDLQDGVIGSTGAGAIATITNVGNGWYRCTLQGTTNAGGALTGCEIITTNNTDSGRYPPYQSTVAEDVCYVWGAQLVIGTQPKDYYPTTTRFNIPRVDYSNGSCPNILVEPISTNQVRNNSMVGAIIGNPGNLPTNWTESLAGVTRQVVGVGVEKGIQYIDIRYGGVATNVNQRIIFEPGTQIVATTGQTWTLSSYIKLIATPQPPTGIQLTIFELTSAGGFVTAGSQVITPTTSFTRYSFTRTLSGGATVARVQPIINFSTVSGQPYDFTIRVYGPQMEQSIVATSLIQTTSATVTRNADVITNTNGITLIGQSEGTIFIDYNKVLAPDTPRNIISLTDGTANNLIEIWDGVGSGNLGMLVYTCTTNSIFKSTGLGQTVISPTGRYKICLTYSFTPTNMNFKFFVNGVKLRDNNYTFTAFNNPLSRINIGNRNGTFVGIGGHSIDFISQTAITETQAINLTTL